MSAERIDKWLFHARFYRTRAMAHAAASAGKVRLNGIRVEKPAQPLKPGDILTLGRGSEIVA
ncbi:MAG TPA: S4 domain-containing protein, partial [Rhizomicrobium sp.]|nr:S4 domain-containing protein [Rhizomicrobium sp.]